MSDLFKKALKLLIRAYSYLISPLMGPNCRFYPTCSAYALEAIEKHGSLRGLYLAVRRILKCHPWHKGPFTDPVPGAVDCGCAIGYKRRTQTKEE